MREPLLRSAEYTFKQPLDDLETAASADAKTFYKSTIFELIRFEFDLTVN